MPSLRISRRSPAFYGVLLSLFFCLSCPAVATAADPDPYLFRLGAGVQGLYPELGYSAVLNLTQHSALQGLFIYNDYAVIWGGKYIYRFLIRPTHNLYAHGLAGHFAFYTESWDLVVSSGFVGGIGLEFTTSDFFTNLKYNLEIGYSTAGVPWGPPGPSLVYSGGIHFYLF
ncbi:MAG TPA: hypothetical protein DDZ55_02175 [Firmicutes bacterium]|nr:hypothetical protein [Bacillota bacterium]